MPTIPDQRAAATALLAQLDDADRVRAHRPLADQHLRWREYRPARGRVCA